MVKEQFLSIPKKFTKVTQNPWENFFNAGSVKLPQIFDRLPIAKGPVKAFTKKIFPDFLETFQRQETQIASLLKRKSKKPNALERVKQIFS